MATAVTHGVVTRGARTQPVRPTAEPTLTARHQPGGTQSSHTLVNTNASSVSGTGE